MQPPPDLENLPSTLISSSSTEKEAEVVSNQKVVNTISSPPLFTQPFSIPGIEPILPNVNIDELFQKLISTGIINTTFPTNSGDHEKILKEEEPKPLTELEPAKSINLGAPESIKIRQEAIINALFSGMQCSSCGVRFPPEQTIKYSQHLDWHFRQNRRDRDSTRKAHSRKWYYEVSDWLQYEEIEDFEDREKNFFESQQIDLENMDENSNQRPMNSPIPSCPAEPGDVDRSCEMCQEKFEQFYNEEQEEWHLRAAIRFEDKIYHPFCYEDYMMSINEPFRKTEDDLEDHTGTAITIDDVNCIDAAIVKTENPESLRNETLCFQDECDDDDVIVVLPEEPSITEIDDDDDGDNDDDEEYVPVYMSREEMGGDTYEDLPHDTANDKGESDVEIQEPNIPFTDLDNYIEEHFSIAKSSHSSNVKIKEEPKDEEDDDFEDVGIVLVEEEDISLQSMEHDENTGVQTISSTVSTPQPSPISTNITVESNLSLTDAAEQKSEPESEGNLESIDNSSGGTIALLGVNKIKINMTKNLVTNSNNTSNATLNSFDLNQNHNTGSNNIHNISTIPVLCSGSKSLSTISCLSLESSAENNTVFPAHSSFSVASSICSPTLSESTENTSNVIQVITSHTTSRPTNLDAFTNSIGIIGSIPGSFEGSINCSSKIRENTTPPLVENEDVEPKFTLKPELQNVKLKRVKKINSGVEASGLCSIM